jgi:hypothetical protein
MSALERLKNALNVFRWVREARSSLFWFQIEESDTIITAPQHDSDMTIYRVRSEQFGTFLEEYRNGEMNTYFRTSGGGWFLVNPDTAGEDIAVTDEQSWGLLEQTFHSIAQHGGPVDTTG